MEYKNKSFPPFNPHTNCKGHAIHMLDCTFESEGDREGMLRAIDTAMESIKLNDE